MTVDLSDVSKQVRGFYNSGITTGHACAQVAYKCLTSPTDYPINDGSFRSLKTIVPPGRVISAVRPAPMRWWMTYPMTIVDTIFKALAPAIPDRVIAGHHADLLASSFHGINNRTNEFFIGSFGPLGGGWGAKRTEDGVSGTVCINDGDTHNSPNEQAEFKFPIVVERYALVPDSGGAGRHRGGLGVERVVRRRTSMMVNNQSDRAHCRPWGLDGGWRRHRQCRRDPDQRAMEDRLSQRQSAGGAAQGGRRLHDPLGRRRRPWRPARAAGRGGARRRAPGLRVSEAAAELYGVVIDPRRSRWTWRRLQGFAAILRLGTCASPLGPEAGIQLLDKRCVRSAGTSGSQGCGSALRASPYRTSRRLRSTGSSWQ